MAIESFAIDPDQGDLYAVNGIDAVMRWDGFASQFEQAGITAPSTLITLAGSGTGAIVGTYYAYLRYLDSIGNVSNLSPISAEFTASGSSGTITSITVATPVVVTSAGHGLSTGDYVKITGVGGVDQVNDTWVITVIDGDSFSLDESDVSGLESYTGGGTWTSGISTITYGSVDVPTEAKVVRRQILRNTDGQTDVFYVDVDTTDITSSSFQSTQTDTLLAAGTKVALLGTDGLPLANGHDVPPNIFSSMVHHLDRMFMAVIVEYNRGSCSVTSGSATVTGAGTEWKTTMAGRFLYVDGATRTYEIESVDESAQTLTLTTAYEDLTDLLAFYSIKAPPAYRRLVQFTPPGEPQSWPPHLALTIQDTGDELTGLFQMGAYIYIVERSHLHKLTFANSPISDGAVFMTANRGAVNQRCIVVVDAAAYMLDELGIHRFSGNSNIEPASQQVQSLFRADDSQWQINWKRKEFFFASLDRQREIIRWHVCLDGNRYPKHALCQQYRTNSFWVEDLPLPVGGACSGYLGGLSNVPQVFYGCQHAKVMAAWFGGNDCVDSSFGNVRGTVTGSSMYGLTDSQQTWPAQGMINAPLQIVSGTGKGQKRRIIAVAGNVLTVDMPWMVRPDTTSVYQIGGIDWKYRSSWFRLAAYEDSAARRFELLFDPVTDQSTATLLLFSGFLTTPEVQAATFTTDTGAGIASTAGQAEMTIDLSRTDGLADKRLPFGKDYYSRGKRYVQYELSGVTHKEPVTLGQVVYEGTLPHDAAG